MAPRHHSAMRYVGPALAELGTRTIFNLLGLLANPKRSAAYWSGPMPANGSNRWPVRDRLGASDAWVVHGSDGLDEITTTGPSHVAEPAAAR